ncbi:hypothetical protein KFK09_011085 [Dendrobium nobile]|uniref:DUF4283 domain-containing protein n=1 Tax=Dendrobium nobile TaxID=94219 RepID=A0A8T3BDK1_DENNO|nr:hypothetical protein KFK09_011085 [Dendrobium nobile]
MASSSNPWGSPPAVSPKTNPGFFDLSGGEKRPSSRSFKDVLTGPAEAKGSGFEFKKSTVKGVPAILFSEEDVVRLAAPYQFTLVGKFTLRRPNLDFIRGFFRNLKLSGNFSIGLLDPRHVAIQLSNDLDYSRIFSRRSYYIANCQMRLLKWTPYFDIKEESPIVPIWLSFPNIRLHFFNQHVLHAIGSVFGRPLQSDQATAARSRPSVARILVEIDITKNHPKEVWLGSEKQGYLQQVEFEKVPDYCNHCRIHGHSFSDCYVVHPQLKKIKSNERVDMKNMTGPNQKTVVTENGEGSENCPTEVRKITAREEAIINKEKEETIKGILMMLMKKLMCVMRRLMTDWMIK